VTAPGHPVVPGDRHSYHDPISKDLPINLLL